MIQDRDLQTTSTPEKRTSLDMVMLRENINSLKGYCAQISNPPHVSSPIISTVIKGKMNKIREIPCKKLSDYRTPDAFGLPILSLVAFRGDLAVAKYLVEECKADLFRELTWDEGRHLYTPLTFSVIGGNDKTIEYMLDQYLKQPESVLKDFMIQRAFLVSIILGKEEIFLARISYTIIFHSLRSISDIKKPMVEYTIFCAVVTQLQEIDTETFVASLEIFLNHSDLHSSQIDFLKRLIEYIAKKAPNLRKALEDRWNQNDDNFLFQLLADKKKEDIFLCLSRHLSINPDRRYPLKKAREVKFITIRDEMTLFHLSIHLQAYDAAQILMEKRKANINVSYYPDIIFLGEKVPQEQTRKILTAINKKTEKEIAEKIEEKTQEASTHLFSSDLIYLYRCPGETPLITATLKQSEKMVRLLLSSGANVDSVELTGHSSLMLAVHVQNIKLVQLLLDYGANLFLLNYNSETALSMASKKFQNAAQENKANALSILQTLQKHQLAVVVLDDSKRLAEKSVLLHAFIELVFPVLSVPFDSEKLSVDVNTPDFHVLFPSEQHSFVLPLELIRKTLAKFNTHQPEINQGDLPRIFLNACMALLKESQKKQLIDAVHDKNVEKKSELLHAFINVIFPILSVPFDSRKLSIDINAPNAQVLFPSEQHSFVLSFDLIRKAFKEFNINRSPEPSLDKLLGLFLSKCIRSLHASRASEIKDITETKTEFYPVSEGKLVKKKILSARPLWIKPEKPEKNEREVIEQKPKSKRQLKPKPALTPKLRRPAGDLAFCSYWLNLLDRLITLKEQIKEIILLPDERIAWRNATLMVFGQLLRILENHSVSPFLFPPSLAGHVSDVIFHDEGSSLNLLHANKLRNIALNRSIATMVGAVCEYLHTVNLETKNHAATLKQIGSEKFSNLAGTRIRNSFNRDEISKRFLIGANELMIYDRLKGKYPTKEWGIVLRWARCFTAAKVATYHAKDKSVLTETQLAIDKKEESTLFTRVMKCAETGNRFRHPSLQGNRQKNSTATLFSPVRPLSSRFTVAQPSLSGNIWRKKAGGSAD